MALDRTKLQCIGVGGSNSLYMYTTTDVDTGGGAGVEDSGYFDDAYNDLRVGDFILANLNTGTSREMKIYAVSASSSSGVTITFPTIS